MAAGKLSAVIAFDSRHYSAEFAEAAALIFAGNGVKAWLFSSLRPTPELSFAIRYLKCDTGIVVTASHNPPQYNGYKAYWNDGSQVVPPTPPPPHDTGIIDEVKIVYTPLHGTDAMLAGKPPIESVLPDFLRFVKGTVIIAHNASFDCGFVSENLARLHLPPLPNKIADTLLMARRLFPGRSHYNLQALASDLGLSAEAAHRALDDARLCMEIFIRCCTLPYAD